MRLTCAILLVSILVSLSSPVSFRAPILSKGGEKFITTIDVCGRAHGVFSTNLDIPFIPSTAVDSLVSKAVQPPIKVYSLKNQSPIFPKDRPPKA